MLLQFKSILLWEYIAKLNFFSLQCHIIFRNNYNMQIFCSIIDSIEVLLLN